MRETELKILFPTEKLDALCFFMGKKELSKLIQDLLASSGVNDPASPDDSR